MYAIFIYLFLLSQFVMGHIGMAKLFQKAGQESWKAYVPFYNAYVWMEITGMRLYRVAFLFLPITNVFIALTMLVELNKSFGMPKLKEECLAIFFPGYWLFYIGRDDKVKYEGPAGKKPKEKKNDWVEAIIFAVWAAVLIRWSTFEPYTIPTPSMEGSLLVGDYLFVSKMSYGPRAPITPLQLPLTHQTFPWASAKSISERTYTPTFLDWIQLPYYRFPGFGDVERNDVVVFNYPGQTPDYNDRDYPLDLRTNYVKRCVAIPGDTITVDDSKLFIDSKPHNFHKNGQRSYLMKLKSPYDKTDFSFLNENNLREYRDEVSFKPYMHGGFYRLNLNASQIEKVKDHFGERIVSFIPEKDQLALQSENAQKSRTWGHDPQNFFTKQSTAFHYWNRDNFGPTVVPFKGMVLKVEEHNFESLFGMYHDVIENLDMDDPERIGIDYQNKRLLIDGEPQTEYVFKKNYYFMMGDNRHNSADSRSWGFVPEDHVVGKALFIWFSVESGTIGSRESGFFSNIRWNRIGKLIE